MAAFSQRARQLVSFQRVCFMSSEKLVSRLDDSFKPIVEAEFHTIPDRTEPSTGIPTKEDVGINLLDKSLRDITGVLQDTKHFLTHEADTLKGHEVPCPICEKAATRQKRKYSEKFRENQKRYEHRASGL